MIKLYIYIYIYMNKISMHCFRNLPYSGEVWWRPYWSNPTVALRMPMATAWTHKHTRLDAAVSIMQIALVTCFLSVVSIARTANDSTSARIVMTLSSRRRRFGHESRQPSYPTDSKFYSGTLKIPCTLCGIMWTPFVVPLCSHWSVVVRARNVHTSCISAASLLQ